MLDGISFKIKREYVNKALEISDNLMNSVGLTYESAFYKQMIIKDVNNYISEYTDNSIENEHIKYKGCFEIDKELHKDSSMKIVPIALSEYFIKGIPIEETIRNHKNIYDFCLRLKLNSSSKGIIEYLDVENSIINTEYLHRTNRYFISNKGGSISVNYNNSNSVNRINFGFSAIIFNRYYKLNDYNINYKFYEIETRKIINVVEDKQMLLF